MSGDDRAEPGGGDASGVVTLRVGKPTHVRVGVRGERGERVLS